MSYSMTAQPSVLADLIARPSRRARALALDTVLVLAGAALVSLLAQVEFPIGPVPITGQTLGVIVVGASLGSRRAGASMISYMLAGLAGMPVFAGGASGPAYLLAPSFGFIIGFIPAAFVAGWFAERAWDRKPWLAFIGFVVASAIPFVFGVPYLALMLSAHLGLDITLASVLHAGLWPFIVPGLVKAAIAAFAIPGGWLLVKQIDRSKQS